MCRYLIYLFSSFVVYLWLFLSFLLKRLQIDANWIWTHSVQPDVMFSQNDGNVEAAPLFTLKPVWFNLAELDLRLFFSSEFSRNPVQPFNRPERKNIWNQTGFVFYMWNCDQTEGNFSCIDVSEQKWFWSAVGRRNK